MDEIFFGLEQEFVVSQAGVQVDFRRLLPMLGAPGRRIDPGDRNAIRTPLGLALTSDGLEAEFAIPPLLVGGRFTEELLDWAAAGGELLTGLLGSSYFAEGGSTHLSVSVPNQHSLEVCQLLIDRFSPALMMMVDGFDSPGLLVRPRAGRVELGLDYIAGRPLAAGSVMAIGAVVACHKSVAGAIDDTSLPPRLRLAQRSTTDRYGWYVDRSAFGEDLYRCGRETSLGLYGGGETTAQEQLELAWKSAREQMAGLCLPDDMEAADDLVAGFEDLPLEVGRHRAPASNRSAPASTVDGLILEDVTRPRFRSRVVAATWQHAIFQVSGARTGYVSVPRSGLESFLGDLRSGSLDPVLGRLAGHRWRRSRVLRSAAELQAHTQHWSDLDGWESLTAPELWADGVRRPAVSTRSGPPTDLMPAGAAQTGSPAAGANVGTSTEPTFSSSTADGQTTSVESGDANDVPDRPFKGLPPVEPPRDFVSVLAGRWKLVLIVISVVGLALLLISVISGSDSQSITEVSTPTAPIVEAHEPTPTPAAEVSDPVPESFVLDAPDEYLDLVDILIQAGVPEPTIGDLLELVAADGMYDGIYSSSQFEPGNFGDDVDQWDVALIGTEATQAVYDMLFNNSVFECDADLDGTLTVCMSSPPRDMEAGELLIAIEVLSDSVASGDWLYTYAAVFDRDGDPANNFVPVSPYDWDYFGGTDSWYVLDFADGQWSGGLFWGSFDNRRPSAARAVIRGNTIVWFIPRQEVPEAAGARTTSFRHDGSFQPEVSGGDVIGENPLDSMIPISQLDRIFERRGDTMAAPEDSPQPAAD